MRTKDELDKEMDEAVKDDIVTAKARLQLQIREICLDIRDLLQESNQKKDE